MKMSNSVGEIGPSTKVCNYYRDTSAREVQKRELPATVITLSLPRHDRTAIIEELGPITY